MGRDERRRRLAEEKRLILGLLVLLLVLEVRGVVMLRLLLELAS